MKRSWKRVSALFLAFVMALSLLPVSALASSTTYEYVLDTDGLDSGAVYAIAAPNDQKSILYHAPNGVKSDQVSGTVTDNKLTLNTSNAAFTVANQTWTVTGDSTEGYVLESVSGGDNKYMNIGTEETAPGGARIPVSGTAQSLTLTEIDPGFYTITAGDFAVYHKDGSTTEQYHIKPVAQATPLAFYKQTEITPDPGPSDPVDPLAIPGYTMVESAQLDPSKYYIIVSKDSDDNLFALYPAPGCQNVSSGNGVASGQTKIAAALTVDGDEVTAATLSSASVDMDDLYFTVEQQGASYSFKTADDYYLTISNTMFTTTQSYLPVAYNGESFTITGAQGNRVLDFNKEGDPNQFVNGGRTYETNFWGPGSGRFSIYLYTVDGLSAPTPKDDLIALVAECAELDGDDYTLSTWYDLEDALTVAQDLLDDPAATNAQLYQALADLRAAKTGLQEKPTISDIPTSIVYQQSVSAELEEGTYLVYAVANTRTMYHAPNSGKTDQLMATPSNGLLSPNGSFALNNQLWYISGSAAEGYTLRSLSDNNYLNSADAANGRHRAVTATPETFTITMQDEGDYFVQYDGGYLCFSDNLSGGWQLSDTGYVFQFYRLNEVPATLIRDWQDMVPDSGVTYGQPFAHGTGGSQNFRIPALITLDTGRLLAAIDARWNHTGDGGALDTIISYSDDNGATWHYSYPNYFGDSIDGMATYGTSFIDPVMIQGKDGTIYLMVDAFPGGVALNTVPQRPAAATGYVEIDGVQRLVLYTSPITGEQTNSNYSYYIGDFADGYADVLDVGNDQPSGFYVDEYFYLYYGDGDDHDADKIFCQRLGGTEWVQQNVFFYNAALHVRNASYLWIITSQDGGETWSKPIMVNDQVRTGNDIFYGVGPGAGLTLDDGTVILPCYTYSNQLANFIYTNDNGQTWHRSDFATGSGTGWSSESCMVQLDENTIRHFYRDGYSTLRYTDHTWNGESWVPGTPVNTGVTKTYNNQLSAIRYNGTVDGKTAILVSTAATDTARRLNGKIYTFLLNEDQTMELAYTYEVTSPSEGYSYSSLSQTDSGDIALLYEAGADTGIEFVVLPMSDVVSGAAVTIDPKPIQAAAQGYEGVYDGQPHAITVDVTAPIQGAVVTYSNTEDGTYTAENPTFTDAGVYTVYYKVSAPNYAEATGSCTVTITPADQTAAAQGFRGVYDGQAHSITVTPDVQGAVVTYSTTKNGSYTAENPAFTSVGLYTVYYKVTAPNYKEVSGSAQVSIDLGILDVTAEGYSGYLSGHSHTIIVTVGNAEDAVITYATSEDGPYTLEKPTFITPGTYTVYYKVNAQNFIEVSGSVVVRLKDFSDFQGAGTGALPIVREEVKEDFRFVDMPNAAWANKAVNYVIDKGIFSGTGSNTFSPNVSMTRGMLATILFKMENQPANRFTGIVTDLKDTWYTQAVRWAMDEGLMVGYDNGAFGADDALTREQLATILWTYDGRGDSDHKLDPFVDADQISPYALKALAWANEKGIINGRIGNALDPKAPITRAEVAQMLMAYLELD